MNVIRMMKAHPAGHVGGALSAADIVTAIYMYGLRGEAGPDDEKRDRFLLSAGHKAMVQYAVLADLGVIAPETLDKYGSLHTPVGGHPDMHSLRGIEANTGALGHGLAIATGMALAARLGLTGSHIYTLLGDGELGEGSSWEAAAIASHHGLSNIHAYVDANGLQISGPTRDVLDMGPIGSKFAAFGWEVLEIDGNSMPEIVSSIDWGRRQERPSVVVAHTQKGMGISEIQGTVGSHYWKPTAAQLDQAAHEIQARIDNLTREAPRGQ